MTPTNWPNPERPGVPPNSDVSGWHWVMRLGELIAVKWDAPSRSWRSGNHSYYTGPDWVLNWEYCSPILTPTQLTDLLEGERERCARTCNDIGMRASSQVRIHRADGRLLLANQLTATMDAAYECADRISKLGGAP